MKKVDPFPPYSKKGPIDENVGISYLIVIVKFGFFQIFEPPLPYFGKKPNFTDFVNWGGPLRTIYENKSTMTESRRGYVCRDIFMEDHIL